MDGLAIIILAGFAAFVVYGIFYYGRETGRQEEQARSQQEEIAKGLRSGRLKPMSEEDFAKLKAQVEERQKKHPQKKSPLF
jgi:hypothetical protein